MKKHWGAFWTVEAVLLSGTVIAVWALCAVHWAPAALAAVCGIIGAAAYFLHFRSLEYTIENECIIIQKGFMIKSCREIPRDSILMTQTLTAFGATICTSIWTAGGKTVVFCEANML